jgi:hypothetical protein
MTAANALAYAGQVSLVVLACAGLPRLLGLRAPGLQYAFWRTVLAVCLLLPFAQPWKPVVMVFVPAPVQPGIAAAPPAFTGPPPAPAGIFDWVVAAEAVILIGITARLAWIALGMIRLRRMRRLATEPAVGFDDLRQTIGAAAPILWSSEVRHPVTFGLFDPVVLLPVSLKAADLPAQRAGAPSRHPPRLGLGSRRGAGPLGVLVPSGDVVAGVARAAGARDGGRRAVDPGDQRAPHLSRHAPGVRRRLGAGFVPVVLGQASSFLPGHAAFEGG